jgi:hypothetical protein
MGILDPKDRIKLCAMDYLRRFVRSRKNQYVEKVKKLKQFIPHDSEFADPRLLAATISGTLMLDEDLRSIMWSIWENDELTIIQYYDIIAKYFVDCETGQPGQEC